MNKTNLLLSLMNNTTMSLQSNTNANVLTCVSQAICDSLLKKTMDVHIYPIICAFLYVILGFVGNSTVIYIYLTKWKKNKTRVFILCLGILDWLNCTFSVPLEIAILMKQLSFDHHILCKVSRGLTYAINNTGALVLVSIAVERFLVVHYPLKSRQLTPRFAKTLCLISFVVASAVVWPAFVFYGTHTLIIPISLPKGNVNIIGKTCLIADEHEIRKGLILIFTTILFGLLILIFIILSTLYIAIGRTIYIATCTEVGEDAASSGRMMRKSILSAITGVTKKKDIAQLKQISSNNKHFGSKIQSKDIEYIMYAHTETNTTSSGNRKPIFDYVPEEFENMSTKSASLPEIYSMTINNTVRNYRPSSMKPTSPRSLISRPLERKSFSTVKTRATRNNTIMMRMVTIAFMLSYAPFLVILIIRYTHDSYSFKYYQSLGFSEKVAYRVFLNSYFINSMINPYIYGFINVQFRKHVKNLFRNIFCSECICKRNACRTAESASIV
ncbi:neuropeptide FF receptor 2-like [Dreissena polymorpha]|uniref:neuropeptide FF receptor 2-like n=1 Tax=Dreissena polymorpha TaxID=45954 RepID=UPI002264113F|nr:neuropeptide FF receptor 2-like [Dreissena polymorpha]